MSKAVLVMDQMPERCWYCCFCSTNKCIAMMDCVPIDPLDPRMEKPNWCPLRLMPEMDDREYHSDFARGVKQGWNDAIRAIDTDKNPHS